MSIIGALAEVPLLAGLDPKALEALAGFTFRKTFEPGELISTIKRLYDQSRVDTAA